MRKADETIWADVQEHARNHGCKCPLRPGMTERQILDEIFPYEGRPRYCTYDRGHICETADFYRRRAAARPRSS